MSITSPGMSISFWGENSCWISSIGKMGARSSGASGARVCGFSGGASGSGRDGSTLTQIVGIWLSASKNLECSCMGNAYLTNFGSSHHHDRNLAGAVNAANQDLLDIGGAAGTGDQNHRAGHGGGIREDGEELIEAGQNAAARHHRDMGGRRQRNQARLMRAGDHDQ